MTCVVVQAEGNLVKKWHYLGPSFLRGVFQIALVFRKPECKNSFFVQLTGDVDFSAMRAHDRAYDSQTQTCTTVYSCSAGVDPVKPVKYPVNVQ